MAIKFNKFERVAGLFVLGSILGVVLTGVSVAIKQGWFEPKIPYVTFFENAEGLRPGTDVRMAGLSAGSVEDVELLDNNRIKVSFYILGKFHAKVKKDSKAQLIRPFIIGDRVLEVSVGTSSLPVLAENSELSSEESVDLMTLVSGKKMGTYLAKITGMMENFQALAEAFLSKDRTSAMVKMFDSVEPLLVNMNTMSTEVIKLTRTMTKDDSLAKVMANVVVLTQEMNLILPAINKENPKLGAELGKMTHSLSVMAYEMDKAMKEMGPEAPHAAKRGIEALNEATVLMKALQKSMFLRSSVEEVRAQESKEKTRMPAAQ